MPRIPSPSWLLLVWCGLVASIASEWVMALAASFSRRTDPRRAGPRLMNAPRGSIPLAILTGTLIAAPAYGIVFEWIHRADLVSGVIIGAVHGILAGLFVIGATVRRHAAVRPTALYRARRFATRVVYGAMMGLLYVVPR